MFPGSRARQRGFGMVLLLALLGMGVAWLVSGMLNPRAQQQARDRQNSATLAMAKEALLGYTTGTMGSGQRPGDLMRPDAASESPGNYDGQAESGCLDATQTTGLPLISSSPANLRCLGRLPWKNLGLSIPQPSQEDSDGQMPWYAVSGNLVDPGCVAYLNPDILEASTGTSCGDARPYPWLTVRDRAGNVLSDRVAAIIFIPGPPVGGQVRPPSPNLGGAAAYLDSVTILAGCAAPCVPGTYSNADMDNDFIAGELSDTFNDRLIYLTADELLAAAERRAALEVRGALRDFRANYTTYPWLAAFADPSNPVNHRAAAGSRAGLVPIQAVGQSFATAFSWSISGGFPFYSLWGTVNNADMASGTVASVNDGSCVWESTGLRRVNCAGTIYNPEAGVARREVVLSYTASNVPFVIFPTAGNIVIVPASGSGLTTRTVTKSSLFGVTLDLLDYDSGSVNVGGGQILFSFGGTQIATSNIRVYPVVGDWYSGNRWERFVTAAVAPGFAPGATANCSGGCLTVNRDGAASQTDAEAVVLTAGRRLDSTDYIALPGPPDPPQARPSGNLYDYFDSVNNTTSGTVVFDRRSATASTFNDQLVVVRP